MSRRTPVWFSLALVFAFVVSDVGGAGAALVATFCEPASGSSVVNITTSLPAPGALILPADPITLTAQE